MRKKKRPSRKPPLDERHYRAIELLAGSRPNYEDISQSVGISRMTLYRWRRRSDFKRELRKAVDRNLAETRRQLAPRMRPKTAEEIEWFLRISGVV